MATYKKNNRMRIWHKIFRYVSSFFLGFWIYEAVEEGWAGNGKWLITWAILLVIHTSLEIFYEKKVAEPDKEVLESCKVVRDALTAERR